LHRLVAPVTVGLALLALSGATAGAHDESERTTQPRVVLLDNPGAGCSPANEPYYCGPFRRAARLTGVTGRIVSLTLREDPVDTLELIARQGHDLVIAGSLYNEALGEAAPRVPKARYAIIDWSLAGVPGRPRNVQGVVFRASEAAYLAGWLAGRLERRRPGRDVVGVVGGYKATPVLEFILGFGAGARRASPEIQVLTRYSNDFVDPAKCKAIAHNQIAKGAGAVFDVAGRCGLGALEAAREAGVWGIGVDYDQSSLGPHILTSVVKRYDAAFLTLFRQVRAGRIPTGGDTVLTLRQNGVGLGKISSRVPASLRAGVDRLRRRIVAGEIRVPGTVPSPR
jgi:basic membrane protein A